MDINILWCILGALELIIVIFIIIYYVKIKKKRKVSEITFINRSIYALILHIVNKVFKKDYVAITNAFNSRIHIINKDTFNNITENDILYKHELVHIYQIKKYGRFKFIIKDLFYSIRYGYLKNPFEVEAYTLESKDIETIRNNFK